MKTCMPSKILVMKLLAQHKTFRLLALLLMLAATFTYSINAIAEVTYTPKNYQVNFKLKRQSMDAGQFTISLQNNNNTWRASSRYKPSFVAKLFGLEKAYEDTIFNYQNGHTSIEKFTMQGPEKNQTVLFDLNKNVYNTNLALPSNPQTNQSIFNVLSNDIAEKKSTASYAIFDNENFRQYEVNYEYMQSITVNKRKIDAVKVVMTSDKRKAIFWLAKQWNWAPVKFERYKNGKVVIKGNFEAITF